MVCSTNPMEAEKGLLCALMHDPKRVLSSTLAAGITAEHFSEPNHSMIFSLFRDMKPAQFDLHMFSDILINNGQGKCYDALEELYDNAFTSAYAEHYIQRMKEQSFLRSADRLSREIAATANQGDMEQVKVLIQELAEKKRPETSQHLSVVRAADWLDELPPDPNPVLEGLFDSGDKVALIASSKMRKSFFALQLALCLAAGRDFLGWKVPQKRKVLLFQFEIKDEHFWRRVYRVANALGIRKEEIAETLKIINARGKSVSPSDILQLTEQEGAEMVILDPLYKLVDGDENSAQDMKPILYAFDRVTRETGAALMYVHHDAKGVAGDRNIRDRGAGSGVLARDYDACITLTAHRDTENAVVCKTLVRNYAPRTDFCADIRECVFALSDLPAIAESTRSARKKDRPVVTDEDIARVAGCNMTAFQEEIRALGLTEREARTRKRALIDSGALVQFPRPRTRETWIATIETRSALEAQWHAEFDD